MVWLFSCLVVWWFGYLTDTFTRPIYTHTKGNTPNNTLNHTTKRQNKQLNNQTTKQLNNQHVPYRTGETYRCRDDYHLLQAQARQPERIMSRLPRLTGLCHAKTLPLPFRQRQDLMPQVQGTLLQARHAHRDSQGDAL